MAWLRRRCIPMLGGFALKKTAASSTTAAKGSNWERRNFVSVANRSHGQISMFSELLRRNTATLAPVVGEEKDKKGTMKEEILKRSKSLYLCFEENKDSSCTAHVIQTIKLSELLAAPNHDGEVLKLGEAAYRCGPESDVPFYIETSLVGSKIIYSGGRFMDRTGYLEPWPASRQVCEFETDPSIDANPKLQPSQVYKTSRPAALLKEVAGQVYCISGQFTSFEEFDKTHQKWLPLDVPPGKYSRHAVVGNKMLIWEEDKTGVLGFDVTRPEKGWTELDSSLGSCIPYVVRGTGDDKLFVKLKSDRGFLMFSCDLEQPLTVRVFHVSHECDSMKPMESLQLPKLPRTFPPPEQCKLFHLEDNTVGLVLYSDRHEWICYSSDCYYTTDDDGGDGDDVNMKEELEEWRAWDWTYQRIHVMGFEYEIAEKSMDIKYKLLTTRCLEYSTRNFPEGVGKHYSQLTGAYVI